MHQVVAEGVIRSGKPVVTIVGLPLTDAVNVECRIFRSRQEVDRIVLRWPNEFITDEKENVISGAATISVREELLPFTSVSLFLDKRPISLGRHWHLDRLYASTEKEFEKYFFRTKNRTGDRETLLFAASQIDRYYWINEAHRCVASVIKAYRAMDLLDQKYCAESIDWLERQTRSFDQIGVSEHPRMDRSHLTVSVQFALAQMYLFVGKYTEFIDRLDRIIAYLRRYERLFPGVMINGCLSILLRCYLRALEGDRDESAGLSQLNWDLYVNNLPRLGRHAIWFKEMLKPHAAVYLSLQIGEDVVAQRKLPSPLVVIKAGHRVNYPVAADTIERNFARLCRGLTRQRERAVTSVSEGAESASLPVSDGVKLDSN